jgi:very-short-patch-repair endonuclease
MGDQSPGLYPWVRFERCTREQWVAWYGLHHEYVDQKAANAYFEGEARFFEHFEERFDAAVKQRTLENLRTQFIHAAVNFSGESPIEQLLLAALFWTSYGYRNAPVEIWDWETPFGKPQTDVVIAPQYRVGNYRVDFAIFINVVANEEIRIVVECDGHEFHEKTKEQAAHDKRRDRELQIAGWKVLRFTGSEIWRDHQACADHVSKLAASEIDIQLRRRGLIK